LKLGGADSFVGFVGRTFCIILLGKFLAELTDREGRLSFSILVEQVHSPFLYLYNGQTPRRFGADVGVSDSPIAIS
jgi:hypothetical protein